MFNNRNLPFGFKVLIGMVFFVLPTMFCVRAKDAFMPGLTPTPDGTCSGKVTMNIGTEEQIWVFIFDAQTNELYYAGLKEEGQIQFTYARNLKPGNYALLGVPGDSEEMARKVYEKLGAVYEHTFQVDCS